MSSGVTVEPIHDPDGSAIDPGAEEEGGEKEEDGEKALLKTAGVAASGGWRKQREDEEAGSAIVNDLRRPLRPQFIGHDLKHGEVGSFALAPPTSPQ